MHVQHAGHELVELQVVKELAVPLQRPLLIDCLHALEEAVTLPHSHRLVRWKRAEQGCQRFRRRR